MLESTYCREWELPNLDESDAVLCDHNERQIADMSYER